MRRRGKKRERGQSLVEVALSFPILLLILSGMLDIGRVYYTYIALEDAAAEGAKFLALNPWCTDNTVTRGSLPTRATVTRANGANDADLVCPNPNNAEFRIVNSNEQQVNWDPGIVMITPLVPAGVDVGDVVRVRIRYQFNFITPGISAIADSILLEVIATELVIDAR